MNRRHADPDAAVSSAAAAYPEESAPFIYLRAAFARDGNPNNPTLPPWPAYATPRRPAMDFDVRSRVVEDYRGVDLRLIGDLPQVVI